MQPHVYKSPRGWMIAFNCLGGFFIADGLFLFTLPIWNSTDVWGIILSTVLGGLSCGLGTIVIISTRTGHIDLYPDAIEVGSALPFWNRRLERKDIAAKMVLRGVATTYVLYPQGRAQKRLRVSTLGNEDDYFRQWMSDIPEASKEFLRNRLFGRT